MGAAPPLEIAVRTMQEADLAAATRIFRVAFATFLNAPDPENFRADRDYIATRFHAHPEAARVAEVNRTIVGSNLLAHWGSFGFFGPLTVLPEYWDRGVARALLAPTVALFDRWGVRESALFTFAHSPKHLALYQKFGYWPGPLTALMAKPVAPDRASLILLSRLDAAAQAEALAACRELAAAVYPGLDLTSEIRSVLRQFLGETLLLREGSHLDGFAVCHCGAGTEAGTGAAYVKFAAVRPGPAAATSLERLLDGCEALAQQRSLARLEAGVNLNCRGAYQLLLQHGFRTTAQGVAMHRPDTPAYNRPDAFVLDDWR